jgi:hypothetical protein
MVNGGVCAKAADTNSADEINAVAAPTAPREKMRVRVILFIPSLILILFIDGVTQSRPSYSIGFIA